MEENKKRNVEDLTFEELMEVLERKTREMEAGDLQMDKSVEIYEHGMKIVELLNKKLDEAESKIVALNKNAKGDIQEEEI